ncbi:hypothetical protein HYH03_005670 [Edaphochlamys debaryana]|uniref:Uncharacterized protein n=1 Tax=Edaphochlamys debaryana TaxID=47281 RepID=A0A835Y912_9CHLO|nr:hypothetical protein HYH03_005670 [Edaphochlamys debaryana]|eukprot:KAG2496446.1 hypothetical protein HYH03_005670 [Edaphochlamys debaryana]
MQRCLGPSVARGLPLRWRRAAPSGVGACHRVVAARGTGQNRQPEVEQGGLDPYLEVAVPKDQRPVNQLTELKNDPLYSWGSLELADYVKRLWGVYAFFFAFVGGPIAYQTFEPTQQPIEWFLSGTTGALLVVAVVVIRIYLGWSYVGDRLLSAAVPYEETGWYDGEMFVKPPEVLMRDRLLGTYEVRPVLAKLRTTLLGSAAALLASSVVLYGLIKAGSDADGFYGRGAARVPRQVLSAGVLYSPRVTDLQQLATDDDAAAAEAAAQGGIPGYCGDRALRAAAGGDVCRKFDR